MHRPMRTMPPRNFKGSVVVITGAAGGIGRAIAQRFSKAGACIVALDVDAAGLEQTAGLLSPAAVLTQRCDITSLDDCELAARSALERFGRVDVLVNNAGVVHRSAFRDTSVEVFRRVMEVNYFGSLQVTKALIEPLVASQGLVIVVSSVAGVAPLYGRSGYSASKHALHGLFESLRSELGGEGVDVLMVCPSFTRSAFEQRAFDGIGGRVTRGRSRVGVEASPDDVAGAIFDAARRRRRLLVHTPVGKLAFVLSRVAPRIYERLMVKKLESELEITR